MHYKINQLITQMQDEARANAHHQREIKKMDDKINELTEKQRFSFSQDRNAEIRHLRESKADMETMLADNLNNYARLAQESMREIPELITAHANEEVEKSKVNMPLSGIGTMIGKQVAERMKTKEN